VRLNYSTERGAGWARAATCAVGFVVLLWAIEFVDVVLGNRLDDEGVRPRDDEGLVGILFAPLLHAGWDHLIANSLPLLVLGFLVFLSGIGRALAATAVIWVVGGLGTWLIAPEHTVHIGASVIVFGWLTYLMLRGIFARNEAQIALGAVILVLYGGLLLGVLPGQPGVSWQGHLFGAIGGGLAAWWLAPDRRRAAYV
jgi:membrane associated rhomboid family serine protease